MAELVIGSRGSSLALRQTEWVAERIRLHNPGIATRIEIIRTKGDRVQDIPLARIGGKGLFVKEIEIALAEGRVDVAVHSMKDQPAEMTEGLVIGAVPERADPSDVLISKAGLLNDLPTGARIGSGSQRRRAQLLHFRPDLEFHDLRGNLDTRLRKLNDGQYDAIVLALAGLSRLGWDGQAERIPFDVCLPAVGQGALAVQTRQDDERTREIVAKLEDAAARAAVTAERALLAALGGGCQTPIAALAVVENERLVMDALVASVDGVRVVRTRETGVVDRAAELGERAARVLVESGAGELLAAVGDEPGPTGMGAA